MSKVFAFIQIPFILIRLIRWSNKQKKFLKDTIVPEVLPFFEEKDGSLEEKDLKKLRDYYGYGVPVIIGESHALLRSKKLSNKERRQITYQGILAGLFDDMFDDRDYNPEEIQEIIDLNVNYTPKNAFEKLLIFSYSNFKDSIKDQAYLQEIQSKTFEVQLASKLQFSSDIETSKLRKITYDKGGLSVLFCSLLFHDSFSEGIKMAWYNIGASIQLSNDIFDVYKDSQNGITTIPIADKSILKTWNTLTQLLLETKTLINDLPFDGKQKDKLVTLYVFVLSRSFVCLDQYEKLCSKDVLFEPKKYNRKELICDMESPRNILSAIKYYLKYI